MPPGPLIPGRLQLPGTISLYLHNMYFASALARVKQIRLYLRIPEHGERPQAHDVALQGSPLLSTVAQIRCQPQKHVWALVSKAELCLNVLALQRQAAKLPAITSELSSAHGYSCKWKIQNTLPLITVLMVQSRFHSKLRDSCLVTKCSLTSFCTMINEVVST